MSRMIGRTVSIGSPTPAYPTTQHATGIDYVAYLARSAHGLAAGAARRAAPNLAEQVRARVNLVRGLRLIGNSGAPGRGRQDAGCDATRSNLTCQQNLSKSEKMLTNWERFLLKFL